MNIERSLKTNSRLAVLALVSSLFSTACIDDVTGDDEAGVVTTSPEDDSSSDDLDGGSESGTGGGTETGNEGSSEGEEAICGNGVVEEGEQCDGNSDPLPLSFPEVCAEDCTLNYATVFVTSQGYTGNLGGLEGADEKCNELAKLAGLPGGNYAAWLVTSDQTQAPWARFTQHWVPYRMPDGSIVAEDFEDLIDPELDQAIDVDEKGNPAGESAGNACDGDLQTAFIGGEQNNCKDFTNAAPDQQADIVSFVDLTLLEPCNQGDCSVPTPIFCFQQ